jgi:integrase/recombinase XerD
MEIQNWIERFDVELKLVGRMPETISCYESFLNKFLVFFRSEKDPQHIDKEQIKRYLVIIGDGHPCQFKQSLAALRYFYGRVVGQPHKLDGIHYRKWNARLPEIIDKSIILPKISAIKDIKYKAIFALIYSTGLRVGEACKIKIEDFNKERRLITVHEGKGGKDRIVPYPESLSKILNEYFQKRHPRYWLFNGENINNYISKSTIEKKCREYFGTHPHALRHCFAVNFLESGGSIYTLSKILGHKDIKTTERYLRLTTTLLHATPNALDEINQSEQQSNIIPFRKAS